MSISLGSLAIAANTNTRFQTPNDGCKAILIGNESGLTVTITMESGGVQKTLYPSTVDWFAIKRGYTGNVKITPTALLNNTSSWPSSSLCFDAIGIDDPEDGSAYPLQLNRNTNIGNTVSTTGGTASSIRNDTSGPLLNLIEATPTDAASSTVNIDTSGNVTIKGDNAGTLTTLLQLVAGASPAVKIAAAAIIAEVLGGLKVDGNLNVLGTGSITGVLSLFAGMAVSGGATTLDGGLVSTDSSGTLQLSKANTAFNGSISGSTNIYTPVWGTSLKVMVIAFNNYNSANAISFTLPTTMSRGWIFVGNQGGGAVTSTFKNGGSAVNVRLVTTLGGAAAGATTTASNMFQDSIASIISTVDTWTMTATGGATSSAIVCVGV